MYIGIGPAELRLVNGTTPTYTHLDTQGSAVAATDSTGAVTWTEHYTPFGDTLLNPAANANNKGYTGYLRDTDFGLNYAETTPAEQGQKGVTPPGTQTEVDHVDPKSNGGSGTPENGQVLCRDCNQAKGSSTPQQQPSQPQQNTQSTSACNKNGICGLP